jgi:hypothetical protein
MKGDPGETNNTNEWLVCCMKESVPMFCHGTRLTGKKQLVMDIILPEFVHERGPIHGLHEQCEGGH